MPYRHLADLTEREMDVLRCLAEGMSDRQIAERLVIEDRTVSSHTNAIFSKLGVTSRLQAALLLVHQELDQAYVVIADLRKRYADAQDDIEFELIERLVWRAKASLAKLGEE